MREDAPWEPVPGFPGYERNRFGEFRSWRGVGGVPRTEPRPLKHNLCANGYLRVCMMRDSKQHWVYVAEAVLEMNVGPRPPGLVACHAPDRTRTNNSPDNLRWGTYQDNSDDMTRGGTQARGATHGRHTKPHRTARGALHGSVTKPGRQPTGAAHWTRQRPENLVTRRGEEHSSAKLTEAQVIRILTEVGPKPRPSGSLKKYAVEFGVSTSAVWEVAERIKWRHITVPPPALSLLSAPSAASSEGPASQTG